jgi:hypothetical protein
MIVVDNYSECLSNILSNIKRSIYDYNEKIKSTGYYLKPYHIVNKGKKKYLYIGKYWYKIISENKLKWIYIGKRKPEPLPDPPNIPLLDCVMYIEEGRCFINCPKNILIYDINILSL